MACSIILVAVNSELPELPPLRRKLLWLTFWFLLFGTPMFSFLAAAALDRIAGAFRGSLTSVFPFAILSGIAAAGFTLGFLFVRLTTRSTKGFVRDVIAFGFIFCLLLVVILAVTIPFITM